MESVPGYPDGEGRHERVQVKSSRRESEAPGEGSEEVKSPKRKVIRLESEETQDYVREANDLNQEESEEISFVPSGISVPQKPSFVTIRCSEKTLSFWQFSSVVIKQGEESHTTNLCQQCHNESLVAKGDEPLTKWRWYEFVEKRALRGRLWKMIGKEQYMREMWEYSCCERLRVKRFREEGGKEWQAGIQGQ